MVSPRVRAFVLAGGALALLTVPLLSAAVATSSAAAAESCTVPESDGGEGPGSIGGSAAASASYTAGWNSIAAVTDGQRVFTGGDQSQLWGTYSGDRPAEQWLELQWPEARTMTEVGLSFWYDRAGEGNGDGVAVPASWTLQTWSGSEWVDAPVDPAAYTVQADADNRIAFSSPVTTDRVRAVLGAQSDGATYAAVAVSEFDVVGELGATDGTAWISSDQFAVGIDRGTGAMYHLFNPSDGPLCTNFVANPQTLPNIDVDDSRWVGDVLLRTNGVESTTGLSDDSRTVTQNADGITVAYSGDADAGGIRGFGFSERYSLQGDGGDQLAWNLTFDNTSDAPLTVEDLGLPLAMSSSWDGGDQTQNYENRVGRHAFVAEDGSYIVWERPSGVGPYLVMVPQTGTHLEFRDMTRYEEPTYGPTNGTWEGSTRFYVHSADEAPSRVAADMAGQFLPASSATIASGDDKTYGFTFRWADDDADLHDVLYDAGVVDTVSLPGMVIPQDTHATLAVRAKDGIDAVVGGGGTTAAGEDAQIQPLGERNGYQLYDVAFPTLGENFVTVRYGGGRTSVLQYYSTEPVETLIDANAAFTAANQQSRDTSRGYDGAFLMWDMAQKTQVTRQNLDSLLVQPIDDFRRLWFTGGSDDLGLAPAAFLAEKNEITPDADEIASIDYYIDHFLLGYLQNKIVDGQRTWDIYHWYDGGDGERPDTADGQATWRVMNSPHVWNTYLGMYRIAQQNPALAERPAAEYLDMAWNTARAYFQHVNEGVLDDHSREVGSMGESTLPELESVLRASGRTAEADQLEGFMRAKYEAFASRAYPFGSEQSVDTTAFEATYTYGDRYGDDAMVKRTTLASLSSRGSQPLWYFYGGDNRWQGEPWWNLGYETQLGAWQQQAYLENHDPAADGLDFDETMRSTYGAYLAGWANINSGQISADPQNYGAASWVYQSQGGHNMFEMMPILNGWWSFSGEASLGFWGGLRTASVDVVDDGIVGLYAYGGDVSLVDGTYTITPKDGVRQRFTVYPADKLGVQLQGGQYRSATVAADGSEIVLAMDATTTENDEVTVAVRNLPAGRYDVTVAGQRAATVSAEELAAGAVVTTPGEGGYEVRIAAAADEPTAPPTTEPTTGPTTGPTTVPTTPTTGGTGTTAGTGGGGLALTGVETGGLALAALAAAAAVTGGVLLQRRRRRAAASPVDPDAVA